MAMNQKSLPGNRGGRCVYSRGGLPGPHRGVIRYIKEGCRLVKSGRVNASRSRGVDFLCVLCFGGRNRTVPGTDSALESRLRAVPLPRAQKACAAS